MGARENAEPTPAGSRIATVLTWLGGGDRRDVAEPHERSSHAVAGVVVALYAGLAWLVTTLAVAGSVRLPITAIVALCAVFGLLVATVTRALAVDVTRRWSGLLGRVAVAVALGVIVGELAALALFAGGIDARLEQQAARHADTSPAVAQASAGLDRLRDHRSALDVEVERTRERRDAALVLARCEYHPSAACPQTQITGVPGPGPEARTANEILEQARRELDNAVAARDRDAPGLDTAIADTERALTQTRAIAVADADRGLGARWVAMNSDTTGAAGPLLLRVASSVFFVLLGLLPMILTLWRGETARDRRGAAHAQTDRAELAADTAIAVKRAEIRAEAEMLWVEQQLANARMAVQAQIEIDREHHRRRVAEALGGPVAVRIEPVEDDVYLPIAAEAEAASRAAGELPAAPHGADTMPDQPAEVQRAVARRDERGGPSLPMIPEVANTALRLIRPFMPPIVARALEGTTAPLRATRQAFEEVEEITFSFKRTRKVTFDSEENAAPGRVSAPPATGTVASRRVESQGVEHPDGRRHGEHRPIGRGPDDRALVAAESERALDGRTGRRELRGPEGPRQLPPAE